MIFSARRLCGCLEMNCYSIPNTITKDNSMTKPKRIFVIGHMGAGKFLLTEALAKRLGWEVVDPNPSLERYIGRSLNEILGKSGEEAFHRCENEILSHYIGKEKIVIVMEESVIATEENRKLLSSEFVIYLKVSVPTQLERMKDGNSITSSR